jgi:hypothetical protein
MEFKEIRKMAKGMGVKTHRMKKTDVIRTIQREEQNFDCYATDRVHHCEEPTCLWRRDCLSMNGHTMAS